jgi:hypothetical protein
MEQYRGKHLNTFIMLWAKGLEEGARPNPSEWNLNFAPHMRLESTQPGTESQSKLQIS